MFHKYSVAVVLETLSLFSVVSSGALLQRLKLTAIKVVEKSSLTFSAVPVWRFSYREWCDQDQALSFKSAKKDAAKEWKSKCVCVSERDRMWVGNKKKKQCESERKTGKYTWWREDLQKTWPWWVWIIWLCGRAAYSSSEALSFHPSTIFFLQKKKTFWQLVNTIFRAKGQEVS